MAVKEQEEVEAELKITLRGEESFLNKFLTIRNLANLHNRRFL